MSTLTINTSQNVQLKQNLASVGQRILAIALDYFMLLVLFYILFILYDLVLKLPQTNIFYLVISVLVFLYPLLMEYFANGQTLGKKIMGIRVVKTDGTAPGLGAYLLRWLLLPIDIAVSGGGIALLSIIFTKKGQRLGDLTAGTTVVRVAQNVNMLAQKASLLKELDENYEPQYLSCPALSEANYALINRSLQAFRTDGNRAPIEAMQKRMEQQLKLDPTGEHPIKFLETLLKDYTYHSLRQAEREGADLG